MIKIAKRLMQEVALIIPRVIISIVFCLVVLIMLIIIAFVTPLTFDECLSRVKLCFLGLMNGTRLKDENN